MDANRRDESAVWLNAYTPTMVQIDGKPGCPVRNTLFSDITLDVFPEAVWHASHVDGLTLENVVLRSTDESKPVKFDFENVQNLRQDKPE